MAKFNFTATHGVELGEPVDSKDPSTYAAWAHFEHDRDQDTAEGGKVYTFGTDDTKVAARLRKVDEYGITEVKDSKAEPDPES